MEYFQKRFFSVLLDNVNTDAQRNIEQLAASNV